MARPSRLIGLGTVAVALVVLPGVAAHVYAGRRDCGDDPIELSVAAAPQIAPAVQDVTTFFDRQRHRVNGRCVQAKVKTADPIAMATLLSGRGPTPGDAIPDVWIPDSSFWVSLVRSSASGATAAEPTPVSVARSPVVVATTRSFAAQLSSAGIKPTWGTLLKAAVEPTEAGTAAAGMSPVRLQILDPASQSAGIAALVIARTLFQGTPNAAPAFAQLVKSVRGTVSPTPEALLAALGRDTHGKHPVVIVPEQALWEYSRKAPAVPASAIYPSEGEMSLDYPFTLTTHDDARIQAAGLLEQAMGTAQAQTAMHALGFRSPDGRPGDGFTTANGLNPQIPRAFPQRGAATVTDAVATWKELSLGTRALALLDVSGSMLQPVAKGVTRIQATVRIGQDALATLPDDTDLGLWTFSTHLDGTRDYRIQVPIGPLSTRNGSTTRRQVISAALNQVRPKLEGHTGLYDSVLAAVRSLRSTYRPGYYNNVLLLTDGKNDDDHGITLHTLLKTLKHEDDPARTVPVISIGFGPGIDMTTLQKIAVQTNGAAYHASSPQDVQRILLELIAERIPN